MTDKNTDMTSIRTLSATEKNRYRKVLNCEEKVDIIWQIKQGIPTTRISSFNAEKPTVSTLWWKITLLSSDLLEKLVRVWVNMKFLISKTRWSLCGYGSRWSWRGEESQWRVMHSNPYELCMKIIHSSYASFRLKHVIKILYYFLSAKSW